MKLFKYIDEEMKHLRKVLVNFGTDHPAVFDFQSIEYYMIALYGDCCYDIIVLCNMAETINNNFKILRQWLDR